MPILSLGFWLLAGLRITTPRLELRWPGESDLLALAELAAGGVHGTVVHGISAPDFAIRREVSSGSWLGQAYHRQGIGTQMRAAILHLAFAGLGAGHAVSSAAEYNAASLGVSRRLGYRHDGTEIHAIRNAPVAIRRLRLDRASWQAARCVPVQITGLEPCLHDFGIAAPAAQPGAGERRPSPAPEGREARQSG
jgi:GNAT superfamily N-acetyltransferase